MQPEELAEVGLEAETTGGMMCPETGYPPSIEKAITDLLEGEKRNVLHLDCLWGELYGAVNASQWDGTITIEQARFTLPEQMPLMVSSDILLAIERLLIISPFPSNISRNVFIFHLRLSL
mgnify:CR=1 FL=1